jgi:hypothetical protein
MAGHRVVKKKLPTPHIYQLAKFPLFVQKHEEEMILCDLTGRYAFLFVGKLVCIVRYVSYFRDRMAGFESDLYLITRNISERFLTKEMHSRHSKWGSLIRKHCVTYKLHNGIRLQLRSRNVCEPPQELSNLH